MSVVSNVAVKIIAYYLTVIMLFFAESVSGSNTVTENYNSAF